jgi:ribonucleoside-diphosphate reductase alpha chain
LYKKHNFSKELVDEVEKLIEDKYDKTYTYSSLSKLITGGYLNSNELIQEKNMILALAHSRIKDVDNVKKLYNLLKLRKLSFGTPAYGILDAYSNGTASCYTSTVSDNWSDKNGIAEAYTRFGEISREGAAEGQDWSRVRATDAPIRNIKKASNGPIPFIKPITTITKAVNQLNKRDGSITIAMNSFHKDIEDMLNMRDLEKTIEEFRSKDFFPQVVHSDLFMQRLEEKADWYLFDPYEAKQIIGKDLNDMRKQEFEESILKLENLIYEGVIKNYTKIPAVQLFKTIKKISSISGTPYTFFKDTVNSRSQLKDVGIIHNGNLCNESYGVTDEQNYSHVCILASIVYPNHTDLEDIKETVKIAINVLDYDIDILHPITKKHKNYMNDFRVIGIGGLGLHDWLVNQEMLYEDSLDYIDNFFEEIAYAGYKESIELAKQHGAFTKFDQSEYPKGHIFGQPAETIEGKKDWVKLSKDIKKYGIRNAQLFAYAPNTSSSTIMGVSPSVLPVYAPFESYIDGGERRIKYGKYLNDSRCLAGLYTPYSNFDHKTIIDIIATIQKWTDTGISFEMIYNRNIDKHNSLKYQLEVYLYAWKKKINALYYDRYIVKGATVPTPINYCVSCSD